MKENSSRIFDHFMLILNPLHQWKSSTSILCPCLAKFQKELESRGIQSIVLSTKTNKIVSIMIWSILSYISCVSICVLWHLEDFRKLFLSQFLQKEYLNFHFQRLISTEIFYSKFSWTWTSSLFLLICVRMLAKGSFTDEQEKTQDWCNCQYLYWNIKTEKNWLLKLGK